MRSSFMRSSASLRHCDIAPWPSKARDKTKPNGLLTEGRFSRTKFELVINLKTAKGGRPRSTTHAACRADEVSE
jgi:hypothetical protein